VSAVPAESSWSRVDERKQGAESVRWHRVRAWAVT